MNIFFRQRNENFYAKRFRARKSVHDKRTKQIDRRHRKMTAIRVSALCFHEKKNNGQLKLIHRDISSAYLFLIVDLRERGTLLQQKNGSKKSQAQKI